MTSSLEDFLARGVLPLHHSNFFLWRAYKQTPDTIVYQTCSYSAVIVSLVVKQRPLLYDSIDSVHPVGVEPTTRPLRAAYSTN